MENHPDQANDFHKAGHQAFLAITKEWGLTSEEQCILLGNIPMAAFTSIEHDPEYRFNDQQLERISYVMGIHKALRTLPVGRSKENLYRWLREPQDRQYAPVFEGKSALEKMLSGNTDDLAAVRYYLDSFLV